MSRQTFLPPTQAVLQVVLPVVLLLIAIVWPVDAAAQITVRGRLAHDLPAAPGQPVTGQIIVDNETSEVQQARVYQTDYLFFSDGTNEYGEPGVLERSNAQWITFSPETMTIPPNGNVTVSYRIDVPSTVEPGTYWSMLMVESIDPSSAESTLGDEPPDEREMGFRQVTRYGVQLATHVDESSAEANVEFSGVTLVAGEDGRTVFQADVVNTGERLIRPDVYLRLFDAQGTEFGPFNGTLYRMYPGTSVRQRLELVDVPSGAYQAILIVDAGDDSVFGGQFELTL
jgi:hypothetical protein